MEALEELVGTGPKDHTHIVKGKRTKRQRPQSPIPFAIATHSSSGEGDGGYGSNGDYTNATATATTNNNTTSSPATSAELVESATEEEEDMANCLILLAQGRSRDKSLKPDDQDHIGFKFKSKRFLAAASTGNGKAGMYVYQCKTCSRTFPSFQALGGHRASHKKPKLAAMAVEKRPVTLFSDDEEKQPKNHTSSSSLSLQLSNRPLYGNSKSSTKIHECSICGAEFMSGQALGGHMRRHRTGGANTTLSLSPLSPIGCDSSEDQEAKKPRIVLSLDLDLNLPAPEESNIAFASKQQQEQQQQSPLALPAVPTLVDCHY